jgi:hypothetical protein
VARVDASQWEIGRLVAHLRQVDESENRARPAQTYRRIRADLEKQNLHISKSMLHEAHEAHQLWTRIHEGLSGRLDSAEVDTMRALPFSAWSKAATVGGKAVSFDARVSVLRQAARRKRQGHTCIVQQVIETLRTIAGGAGPSREPFSVRRYQRRIDRIVRDIDALVRQAPELDRVTSPVSEEVLESLEERRAKLRGAIRQMRELLQRLDKKGEWLTQPPVRPSPNSSKQRVPLEVA